MRTIAIVNQKGGCGKTTTAINLAAIYAKRGLRTLLVDMDPQSHCAAGLGVPESRIEYSIGDALLAEHTSAFDPTPLVWEVSRNLYLAPSTVMLTALESPGGGLHQLPDKDRRLESLFKVIGDRYDRCLIDCPPTIGLLTFNAMRAAREALIPVETGFFSLRGAERQWTTIQRMIAHIGRPMACHLLPTLHKPESQLATNILAALRRQFAGQILPIIIHEHEVLREAASFGQPVLEYAPESKARADFETLADWLEEHAARPTVQIEVMTEEALGIRHQAPESERAPVAPALVSIAQCPAPNIDPGSRAAELVRRVHQLAARASTREREADEAPSAPMAASEVHPIPAPEMIEPATIEPKVEPAWSHAAEVQSLAAAVERPSIAHLYGVRKTSQGVLFVQPSNGARSMAIAGDFNHWSPSATPMQFNDELNVFQSIVELPAGTYQYRVVMDGEWIPDLYNGESQLNPYGEPNSVVTVS